MPSRRHFIQGLLAGPLLLRSLPARAQVLEGTLIGLQPDAPGDQSAALGRALQAAARQGRDLWLAPGRYTVGKVALPGGVGLIGAPGAVLVAHGAAPVLTGDGVAGVRLAGLTVIGAGGAGADLTPDPADIPDPGEAPAPAPALVAFENCSDLTIERCRFLESPGQGLALWASGGVVRANRFRRCRGAAISVRQSAGLHITENRIEDCADLGIYIAREAPGSDGSIIRANRISGIGWASGGNGQFGNGINAYNAGALVIADNVIDACAFSAIRLNSTANAVVSSNVCTDSGEVAIFAEFAFSGAAILGNVIDGAAQGISITNFDTGGRLASCSGNIVRNIRARSTTNPDTMPVGISVEADTALTGNVVENVPGVGLALGWGPYLRNVSASGNVVRAARIGMGISVVEGVGPASVTGNLVEMPEGGLGIAGMEWNAVTVADLTAPRAADYTANTRIALTGNLVIPAS